MSYLTASFTQEIEKELNSKYFLAEDFNLETTNHQNYVTLIIKYIYLPQYRFEGVIFRDEEKFSAQFSPGTITISVRKDNLTKYNFLTSIREWLHNIFNEITKTPLARQVRDQEELLNKFKEKIYSMGKEGNNLFSKEEGEELRNKLNELEGIIKESIIQTKLNDETQDQELDRLKLEVDTLKAHLEVLSKKNWFLSFSTRLFNWFKRNPNLTRQLAGFSREMLPQEARDIVSQEALDQLILPPASSEIASDTDK